MKNFTINQKVAITASILGLIDSAYLLFIKLTHNQAMCLPGLVDCWTVNNSQYSEILGIPVSALGIAAYLIIFVLLVGKKYLPFPEIILDQLIFGATFAGFIYSFYLTYLEIAVIKAVCPFCVVSALLMTTLFVCTLLRLVQNRGDYILSLEEKNG